MSRVRRGAAGAGKAAGGRARVLLIDDGTDYAALLAAHVPEVTLVAPRGSKLPRVEDGKAAMRFLERAAERIDLVLLDMHFDLPDAQLLAFEPAKSARRTRRFQGLRILQALRARWPSMPVLLLTSEADLSVIDGADAVGAHSLTYFLDGDDLDSLRIRMHAALHDGQTRIEDGGVFWGDDAVFAGLRKRMAMLARGRMPLILEGETGTGKSFLAEHFVHHNSGRRGKFVVLDLSTVPRELVSAHLFGAVRGAYTGAVQERRGVFEAADGGTLFIDEIQNVPLELQKQLLLVLQDGRVRRLGSTEDVAVDVKVIAASNVSLQRAVTEGRFRADLYMRLSPATRVRIPPLRERAGDLPVLCAEFIRRAGEDPELAEMRGALCGVLGLPAGGGLRMSIGGKAAKQAGGVFGGGDAAAAADGLCIDLPAPVWRQLQAHGWPGNLRELSMVLHNLVTVTLVQALDAARFGTPLRSARLQVDPLLLPELLAASRGLASDGEPLLGGGGGGARASGDSGPAAVEGASVSVQPTANKTLNAVAQAVERQYLTALFERYGGDLSRMAEALLGDTTRTRAIRLRLNQLGLSLRDLRGR